MSRPVGPASSFVKSRWSGRVGSGGFSISQGSGRVRPGLTREAFDLTREAFDLTREQP